MNFKMKLKCWILSVVTMRAQDLPTYIRHKKIDDGGPLGDPTERFKCQEKLKSHQPLLSSSAGAGGRAGCPPVQPSVASLQDPPWGKAPGVLPGRTLPVHLQHS